MLQLKNITKVYEVGDAKVQALKGVTIDFRENEFVSILGPSGCGKTTLLNIIGGLDRYTDGDLVINGKTTRDYRDGDWDTYRNHSIGFVFQSYNLIPHQTVLANVELALTLSGVSKAERRRRALEALEKVGLGDQIKKKPNQMSGGQMQRVAIARAIVNDPDILLADEPTGALDTQTSIQIMELLKEIARDKLVIMVTHNPQLAEQYSTRIVRLLDGKITDDSAPFSAAEEGKDVIRQTSVNKGKHTSMSLRTAFSLSLNNLMTKKGRTFMTVFAGSIGIIGIALILSLSNGINSYIDTVQKDTLSSYPIQLKHQAMDMASMMANMMSEKSEGVDYASRDPNKVYSSNIMADMMNTMSQGIAVNNLQAFKAYLESDDIFSDTSIVSAVQYTYDMNMQIYKADTEDGILKVNPSQVLELMMAAMGFSSSSDSTMDSISDMYGLNVWSELLDNQELLESQYELLDPDTMHWPSAYNEIIIVVNKHNELSDISLYALGLRDASELSAMMEAMSKGEAYEVEASSYTYEDLMNLSYSVVLSADLYEKDAQSGTYTDRSGDSEYLKQLIADGIQLKVVGLVRAREGAVSTSIDGTVGYTKALTEFVALATDRTEVVKEQKANPDVNVLTGQTFDVGQFDNLTDAEKAEIMRAYAATAMSDSDKSKAAVTLLSSMSAEEREALLSNLSEEEKAALLPEDYGQKEDVWLRNYIVLNLRSYEEVYHSVLMEFLDMSLAQADEETRKQLEAYLSTMTEEQILTMILQQMGSTPEEQEQALRQTVDFLPREKLLDYASRIGQAEVLAKLENMEGSLTQMALIFDRILAGMSDGQAAGMYDTYRKDMVSALSYDEVMLELGCVDLDNPSGIQLYAASFEAKDTIQSAIEAYNQKASDEGREGDVITYTDLVGTMMSFFTDIINAVSYVLIAFVSISLVVSSIMIGIITYISVLERTKEIGILRAMGASKRDITRVFNAETMLIGVTAGLFGIGVTVILCFPINMIIRALTGIPILTAALPVVGGVILVFISVILTTVAGLIPSFSAAKKDPVVALRTE